MREGFLLLALALLFGVLRSIIEIGEGVRLHSEEILIGFLAVMFVCVFIVSFLLSSVWLIGKIVRGERLWIVSVCIFLWGFACQGRGYFLEKSSS